MKDITENEMNFILTLLKNPEHELNSRNISKIINITPMGSLKIAKRIEKQGISSSKQIGKTIIYKLNLDKDYVKQYVKFLLQREAESSSAYIKRWIADLKKIKKAEIIVLFGSVLKKSDEAKDIDALIVVEKANLNHAEKEIEEINLLNKKKIHPIFQTKEDLKKNIKSLDKVILNSIKGIVILGEENFIETIR